MAVRIDKAHVVWGGVILFLSIPEVSPRVTFQVPGFTIMLSMRGMPKCVDDAGMPRNEAVKPVSSSDF